MGVTRNDLFSEEQNELAQMDKFEYRVINKDNLLHQAIIDVDAIITAEKCRMKPRLVELL